MNAGGGLCQPRPYRWNNSGALASYHRIVDIRSRYRSFFKGSGKALLAFIRQVKIFLSSNLGEGSQVVLLGKNIWLTLGRESKDWFQVNTCLKF